ncbi:MAG: hypothetical protein JW940_33590 [Polyangiaceae bacterium]|nr:hypothetical protein [Polyangiaceae bacterium]
MLDPIKELVDFGMLARVLKLEDATLETRLAALRERMRSAKGDAEWVAVYQEALVLFERVLEACTPVGGSETPAPLDPASAKRKAQALAAAQSALQQAHSSWTVRLTTQLRNELWPKLERSVVKLEVSGTIESDTGMTRFVVEPQQLEDFYGWLASIERRWLDNNGELVAVRANEGMREAAGNEPFDFEVRPAALPAAPPCTPSSPRLHGHAVSTPGPFELLGSTYKIVMSVVTAVASVGFMASRYSGSTLVAGLLRYALLVALVGAVVSAAMLIPKRRRQGNARLKHDATQKVQAELLSVLERRFNQLKEDQLGAIRKHLSSEATRLGVIVREAQERASSPTMAVAALGARLSAKDEANLRGPWREATNARLVALGGETS